MTFGGSDDWWVSPFPHSLRFDTRCLDPAHPKHWLLWYEQPFLPTFLVLFSQVNNRWSPLSRTLTYYKSTSLLYHEGRGPSFLPNISNTIHNVEQRLRGCKNITFFKTRDQSHKIRGRVTMLPLDLRTLGWAAPEGL